MLVSVLVWLWKELLYILQCIATCNDFYSGLPAPLFLSLCLWFCTYILVKSQFENWLFSYMAEICAISRRNLSGEPSFSNLLTPTRFFIYRTFKKLAFYRIPDFFQLSSSLSPRKQLSSVTLTCDRKYNNNNFDTYLSNKNVTHFWPLNVRICCFCQLDIMVISVALGLLVEQNKPSGTLTFGSG